MFLELQVPDAHSKMSSPYIFIDTTGLKSENENVSRSRIPWLASQTDMLSEDWELINEISWENNPSMLAKDWEVID